MLSLKSVQISACLTDIIIINALALNCGFTEPTYIQLGRNRNCLLQGVKVVKQWSVCTAVHTLHIIILLLFIECGECSTNLAAPRVINGEDVTLGRWPWHATVYIVEGGVARATCGGSLLTDSHVITAAHCFNG